MRQMAHSVPRTRCWSKWSPKWRRRTRGCVLTSTARRTSCRCWKTTTAWMSPLCSKTGLDRFVRSISRWIACIKFRLIRVIRRWFLRSKEKNLFLYFIICLFFLCLVFFFFFPLSFLWFYCIYISYIKNKNRKWF